MTRPAAPAFAVADLAAHRTFLHRVVAAVLADGDAVDDVVQDTAVRALRRAEAPTRGWLATVATRLAFRHRRALRRRWTRERAAARAEAVDPPDPALRAELVAAVAAAVRDLPPSLRDAVVLRHYQGLAVGEVAARLEVSPQAARSRLRRAHEELRRALSPQRDRLPALLPAAAMVAWKPLVAVAAVVVLAMALWLLAPRMGGPGPGGEGVAAPLAQSDPAERGGGTTPVAPVPHARTTAAPGAAVAAARVTGIVVDEARMPVAAGGATVELAARGVVVARTETSTGGRFTLPAPAEWTGTVTARGAAGFGFEPVDVTGGGEVEVALVLQERRALAVTVVDGTAPVAGAQVVVRPAALRWLPRGWRAATVGGEPRWLGPEPCRWVATTDARGQARFDDLVAGVHEVDVAAGARAACAHVDAHAHGEQRLRLDIADVHPLRVVVRTADGAPVQSARLRAWRLRPVEGGMTVPLPLHDLAPLPVTAPDGTAVVPGAADAAIEIEASCAAGRARGRADPGAKEIALALPPRTLRRWPVAPGEVPVPPADTVLYAVADRPDPAAASIPVRLTADGALELEADARTWYVYDAAASIVARLLPDGAPVSFRRVRTATLCLREQGTGAPLPGWPIWLQGMRADSVRTGADGCARFAGLWGGHGAFRLDDEPGSQSGGEIGLAPCDVEAGDCTVEVQRAPAVAVRARVTVDGAPMLPPVLSLHGSAGFVEGVVEDPAAATVEFRLWPHDPTRDVPLRAFATWDMSVATASILAPAVGAATVALAFERRASLAVELLPPPDADRLVVWLQRRAGSAWSTWSIHDGPPQVTATNFRNLRPGRFRLWHPASHTASEEVELGTHGRRLPLRLDLRGVATVTGRVWGPPGLALSAARIEVDGELRGDAAVSGDGRFALRLDLHAPRRLRAVHPQATGDEVAVAVAGAVDLRLGAR